MSVEPLMTSGKTGPYLSSMLVQHLGDLLSWYGMPVAQSLAEQNMTRADLNPASGRLPLEFVRQQLHLALQQSGDPHLFLRMSNITVSTGFGVLGYLLPACETLKDCIDNMGRYELLISNAGRSTLEHKPGQVWWTLKFDHADAELVRQAAEFVNGARYRLLLLVNEKRSSIVQAVHFRHAAPDENGLRVYREIFHCPVLFSQADNCLVLHPHALNFPMRQPDASLKEVIDAQAEKKLGELAAPESFRDEVKRELQLLLKRGRASREQLAEKLRISSRHLGRQLENAGIGYRELLDELRMENARELLLKSAYTVDDIGTKLGFSDGKSFIRWFRQAAGITPGEFRQKP